MWASAGALVAPHHRHPLLLESLILPFQVLTAVLGVPEVATSQRFVVARREVENVDELIMSGLD